jgi:hypothetical protein
MPHFTQKSLTIALAAGLAFTGCQGSKQKSTWQKVTETRPDKLVAGEDASQAYIEKLQKVLAEDKVEHKVVTYQYRYETRLRDEAVGTGVAVIYKDNSDPANPWWLMNDRLRKPVWLPGQDVDKQVTFYLQRTAQVIDQQYYPDGQLAPRSMIAKNGKPAAPQAVPTATLVAKAKPAPAPAVAPASAPALTTAQLEPRPFQRRSLFAPRGNGVKIPFTTPAPASSNYDTLFRRAHGTDYDPSSPVDRQKMESLKHAQLETREPAPTRTF